MSKKRHQKTMSNTPPVHQESRFPAIDALRGTALLAMFAYHFTFDINYFGVIRQNFYEDPFWIGCRALILSSFLLLVGINLVLANRNEIRWKAVAQRFAQVAGCAALVSVGSYWMFPQSGIFFGVLHHIAVASLFGLAFLHLKWMNGVLGLVLIGLGVALKLSLFDAPALQWIGLMTHKPITEDYVPMLPWFGVVLLGTFVGNRLLSGNFPRIKTWQPTNGAFRLLALAGRHSLLLYMAHQPVFIGILQTIFGGS